MPKTTKNNENHENYVEEPENLIPDFGVDVEAMHDESISLPPYWQPDEEALEQGIAQGFHGRLVGFDDKDPAFPRYVLINEGPKDLTCKRGPSAEAEDVIVHKGEHFTCSVYDGLPLGDYAHLPVLVYVKDKVSTSTAGRTVWIWGMKVNSETQKILQARRAEAAKDSNAIGHIPGHKEVIAKSKEAKLLQARS
jgi:hypothetical protein